MKVHAYLESVIGSRTAIALVRTMLTYRGKVFTIRGLAEATGISPSEASIIVKQLEDAGAVSLQPAGKALLITPNEQSYVLQKIIAPIILAESDTVKEISQLLRSCFKGGKKISSAYIFGSVARGEEKDDSDIDLLVISDDIDAADDAISRAQRKVAAVFNKKVSPLVFTEDELISKRKGKLVETILSDHIHIFGKDILHELE
jgi:predicted nucleotidyltransferase